MGLSDIDLNKYEAVIRFKHSISESPVLPSPIKNVPSAARKVNEYGEVVTSKLEQAQKRLNEDEIHSLISAYDEGKTTYQLAEQFGCDRGTVSRILKKHGVKIIKCKAQEKLNTEEVIALYENMHTSDEIAKKLGVNPQTILRCLRSHGVKIRSRWDY